MATQAQVKSFIQTIAPIIQKYAKQYGYKVASPIIAQACSESAYGTSSLGAKYHNYFGMKCGSSWKGASVNLATKEEYKAGTLTTIRDNFRVYANMDEGVKGYFDFISTKRYENLKTATTPQQYLELIKADGYATSSTYVKTNIAVVDKYNLVQYDGGDTVAPVTSSNTYPKYTGTSASIVDALVAVVERDTSYSHRKKIAAANGISNYAGTASQNTSLLKLLKDGKLIKA